MTATSVVDAHAKVNLSLRVMGVREDGYHELETLIAPISLADRLELQAVADPSFLTLAVTLEVRGEDTQGIPRDDSNLVVRAASALAERAGIRGFADITLEKRVPAAAGLGGGSADAAATLRALNDLWGSGLDDASLREIGASVGSDVPALLAARPVVARGRGERVEPAEVPVLPLALVRFAFGVSTPDAFRWWDEDGSPAALASRFWAEGIQLVLANDLEGPVAARHPVIAEAKQALLEAGAAAAAMTGSGPTVFGVLRGPEERLDPAAERAIASLAGHVPIYVTTGAWDEGGIRDGA